MSFASYLPLNSDSCYYYRYIRLRINVTVYRLHVESLAKHEVGTYQGFTVVTRLAFNWLFRQRAVVLFLTGTVIA